MRHYTILTLSRLSRSHALTSLTSLISPSFILNGETKAVLWQSLTLSFSHPLTLSHNGEAYILNSPSLEQVLFFVIRLVFKFRKRKRTIVDVRIVID